MSEVEIDCDVVELCVARDAADAAFRKHCTEYAPDTQALRALLEHVEIFTEEYDRGADISAVPDLLHDIAGLLRRVLDESWSSEDGDAHEPAGGWLADQLHCLAKAHLGEDQLRRLAGQIIAAADEDAVRWSARRAGAA